MKARLEALQDKLVSQICVDFFVTTKHFFIIITISLLHSKVPVLEKASTFTGIDSDCCLFP